MISFVKGKIIFNNGQKAVILTSGGVGYEVKLSKRVAEKLTKGAEAEILTYLAVRENALDLYGFNNAAERDLFMKFLEVGGIGPKTALHLLALGSVEETVAAIGRGDVSYLTKVSGIGKKTAELIVVELKNKMGFLGEGTMAGEVGQENSKVEDVIDGLIALGYSVTEARNVVRKLEVKGKTSEQLLKEALQKVK